jgi:hypothetical protein
MKVVPRGWGVWESGSAHVVVVVQGDIAQPTADENAAPDMFVVRDIPVF